MLMKHVDLQLREDLRKGLYVKNLSEVEVHGIKDVIHPLNQVMFKSRTRPSLNHVILILFFRIKEYGFKEIVGVLTFYQLQHNAGSCEQESDSDRHEHREQSLT